MRTQGEGSYQSVTDTKWRGEGAVVSHPFLGEVECSGESSFSGRSGMQWWVMLFWGRRTPCRPMGRGYDSGPSLTQHWLDSFPRRGEGTVMSQLFQGGGGDRDESSKGGGQGRGTPPVTAKERGWGADYVNVQARWLHYYWWVRWYSPPDTWFKMQTIEVWGRARYLSVIEVPHNTEFYECMGKKHVCFF